MVETQNKEVKVQNNSREVDWVLQQVNEELIKLDEGIKATHKENSSGKITIPASIIGIAKENIKSGGVIDNILQKNIGSDAEILKDILSKETLINICNHFLDKATVPTFNVSIETNYLIDQFERVILDINFLKKFLIKKNIESGPGKNFEEKCKNKFSEILSKMTFIIGQVISQSILDTKKVYVREIIPRKDHTGKANIKDYPLNYKGPDKYQRKKISASYVGNITYINTNMYNLKENIKSSSQIKKISKILE
ncbi:MAG: hypothetical protein PHT72_02905 [Candidatus Absconditabacteria bacterium]|nr:hypothetical protein [Candidatus Absconditabacteria bacterium]